MRSGHRVSHKSIGSWWYFNEFADIHLIGMLFELTIYSQTTGRRKSSRKVVSILNRQQVWWIHAILGLILVLYRPTAQPHSTQLQVARIMTPPIVQADLQQPLEFPILDDLLLGSKPRLPCNHKLNTQLIIQVHRASEETVRLYYAFYCKHSAYNRPFKIQLT